MVSINSILNLNTEARFKVFESNSKSAFGREPSDNHSTTAKSNKLLKPVEKRSLTTSPSKKKVAILPDVSWRGETYNSGKDINTTQEFSKKDIITSQFSISEFIGSMPNIKPKNVNKRVPLNPLEKKYEPKKKGESLLVKAKTALFPKTPLEEFQNVTLQNFTSFYNSTKTTQLGSTSNTPWPGGSNMSSFYSPSSKNNNLHRRSQSQDVKSNPAIMQRTISYRSPGGHKKLQNSLLDYIKREANSEHKGEDSIIKEKRDLVNVSQSITSQHDRDKMMDKGKFSIYLGSLKGDGKDFLNKRTLFKKILDDKEDNLRSARGIGETGGYKKTTTLPNLKFNNRQERGIFSEKRKEEEKIKSNDSPLEQKKFHQIGRTSVELDVDSNDVSSNAISMPNIKRVSMAENVESPKKGVLKTGRTKEIDSFPRQITISDETNKELGENNGIKDFKGNKIMEIRKSLRERYSFKKAPTTLIIPKDESLEISWKLSERLMDKLKILFEINSNKNKTFNDVKKLIEQIELLQNAFLSPHGSHFNPNLTAAGLQKFLVTEPPKFAHESLVKTFQIKLHMDNIKVFEEFDQRVSDYIFSKKLHKLKLSEQELISRFSDYKKTQRHFLSRYDGAKLKEMKEFVGKESGGVLEGVRNSDFPLMDQVDKFEKRFGELNYLEKEKRVFGKKLEESILAIIEATNRDDSFQFIKMEEGADS